MDVILWRALQLRIRSVLSICSAGLDAMFGKTPEEHEAIMVCADVDGDGVVTIKDATCILLYYARNSAGLPCEWSDVITG